MKEKMTISDSATTGDWTVITDNVMGGLSEGAVAHNADGFTVFSGSVSLENNGGFASMRYTGALPNLSECQGFKLFVQGDGKTYQLRAHSKSAERGHAFKCDFQTTPGEWVEIELPFNDFILSAHGQLKPDAGKLNPSDIHQISILIAGGQSGEFTLQVRGVAGYR